MEDFLSHRPQPGLNQGSKATALAWASCTAEVDLPSLLLMHPQAGMPSTTSNNNEIKMDGGLICEKNIEICYRYSYSEFE